MKPNPFKSLREWHDWTLAEAAMKTGTSISTWAAAENGGTKRPETLLVALVEHGHDSKELEAQYTAWRAEQGKLVE